MQVSKDLAQLECVITKAECDKLERIRLDSRGGMCGTGIVAVGHTPDGEIEDEHQKFVYFPCILVTLDGTGCYPEFVYLSKTGYPLPVTVEG
jgi:hypothetical protein